MVLSEERCFVPLPRFIGRLVMEAPSTWSWGALDKEKRRLKGYFRALQQLREAGLNGFGVISAYHKRRNVPLMARALPLYHMNEGADLSGTMMSSEGIDKSEVLRRLKETFDPPIAYPDPQPPAMLPGEGAPALVCFLLPLLPSFSFFFCQVPFLTFVVGTPHRTGAISSRPPRRCRRMPLDMRGIASPLRRNWRRRGRGKNAWRIRGKLRR